MSEVKDKNKKITGKVFDLQLFARLLNYAKEYKFQFIISTIAVVLLAVFAAVRPVLLQKNNR